MSAKVYPFGSAHRDADQERFERMFEVKESQPVVTVIGTLCLCMVAMSAACFVAYGFCEVMFK